MVHNPCYKQYEKKDDKKVSTSLEKTFQVNRFPLCILNHIRHLNNNFILKNCNKILPVEKFNNESVGCSELKYVLNRLNPGENLYLNNGWTLFSLLEIKEMNYEFQNIWKTAKVCFHRYMGMGHYQVLAFDHETKQYFRFEEGGSNGYDRRDSYTNAIALTSSTIYVVDIYSMF